jgi:hypothetical protein
VYFSPLAFSAWDKSAVFCARFVSSRSLISSSLIFFARLSCAVRFDERASDTTICNRDCTGCFDIEFTTDPGFAPSVTALPEDAACRFIRGLLLLLLVDTIFVEIALPLDCFLRFRRGTYNGASSSSSFIFVDSTACKALSLDERSLQLPLRGWKYQVWNRRLETSFSLASNLIITTTTTTTYYYYYYYSIIIVCNNNIPLLIISISLLLYFKINEVE